MNVMNETLTAVLLLIPIFFLIISSIRAWPEQKKPKENGNVGKKAAYNKPFYYLLAAGYFLMWIIWIGGIVLLFTSTYARVLQGIALTSFGGGIIQIIGFILFYIGSVMYNLTLITAGKYLRPSNAGTLKDHRLVDRGPFAVIRHPLYVSYCIISLGLGLVLLRFLFFIPAAFIIIGLYPTANAEEEVLMDQLGDEYMEYRKKTGMLFPKLSKSK
jgi:protein-S-isoprenylcysteine O-methyltransferase Ste14